MPVPAGIETGGLVEKVLTINAHKLNENVSQIMLSQNSVKMRSNEHNLRARNWFKCE